MQDLWEWVSWKKTKIHAGKKLTHFPFYSDPECVLEYIGHLIPRKNVGEIWEDEYKVSLVDFRSSVDLTIYEI